MTNKDKSLTIALKLNLKQLIPTFKSTNISIEP